MDQSNHPYVDVVLAVLEVHASERPDALSALVSILRQSPVYAALADVRRDWGVGHEAELVAVARTAAADLDRLESRAVRSLPIADLDAPNLVALFDLAAQREKRVPGQRRRAKLKAIGGRLVRAYTADRARKAVDRFLKAPPAPVDSAWLSRFIKRPTAAAPGGDSARSLPGSLEPPSSD